MANGIEVGMVEQARQEERGALAGRTALVEHRPQHAARIPHVDQVDRRRRPATGISSAAIMPMPWPTGAPVIDGGECERPACREHDVGLHPTELANLGADRAVRVHDTLRIARRARRVRDQCGRARVDGGQRVDRAVARRRSSNGDVAGPRVVADHGDPLEIGQIGSHRVEVREEVLRTETIGRDQCLHARAGEDVRRPPSVRRSARSAPRPRRGTRPRRTSRPPRASSAAGTRSRRRARTPRARMPAATRRASASTSPSVPRYGRRSERTVNGSARPRCNPSASRLPERLVVPEAFAAR